MLYKLKGNKIIDNNQTRKLWKLENL
jgi:hypothetical protein